MYEVNNSYDVCNVSNVSNVDGSSSIYKLYVDGSYMNGKCGLGWVLVNPSNEVVAKESMKLDSDYGMHQVTGELYAVLFGVHACMIRDIKEVEIHFDYLGIREWVTGAWKAKNPNTQNYRDLMREILEEMKVTFVKVKSHSGDYFNDMADRLAKEACM